MDFKLISVGIADYKIATSPDILRTILGSCVGVCCYDSEREIAGLAHIMLPSKNAQGTNEKKYADTAIPLLLHDMEKAGARRDTITAKIMGGASMFKVNGYGLMSEIGINNVNKVKAVLTDLNIAIIAEDTGGDYGRTIDFYSADGMVKIKSIGKEVKML